MARAYTAQSNNISVSAVQDLMSIQTTSGMVMEIDELAMGQVTAITIGNLRTTFKRFSGAYSIGSGGSSVTPRAHVFGDSAAICTARANDTVQTTGGTSVTLDADAINVVNGISIERNRCTTSGLNCIISPCGTNRSRIPKYMRARSYRGSTRSNRIRDRKSVV